MRDKIEKALKKLGFPVYYGIAPETREHEDMNFFVFGQQDIQKGSNGSDLIGSYYVIIVRENYIEDELVFNTIDAVESILGMKLTSDRQRYDYLKKGKTDFVAETLMLTFRRTKKRY